MRVSRAPHGTAPRTTRVAEGPLAPIHVATKANTCRRGRPRAAKVELQQVGQGQQQPAPPCEGVVMGRSCPHNCPAAAINGPLLATSAHIWA
jgi:hypothetical protein